MKSGSNLVGNIPSMEEMKWLTRFKKIFINFFDFRPRQSWISNSLGTLCFIEFVLKLDIRSECFK